MTKTIPKELLNELLRGVDRPEDLLGDKGLMKELKVRNQPLETALTPDLPF